MIKNVLFAICGCSICTAFSAHAQQPDFDAVEFRTVDLGGGMYMLQGMGGNIGVSVGEDGVFVIDDDFSQLAPKMQRALRDITDKPVMFVLNTHWHGDHTGGNAALARFGATIVAHDNVRVRMAAPGEDRSPGDALPVITFSEDVTFHFNGHEIAVTHPVDAHTDGDAVVHFVDLDLIHAGDILFNGMYPFIDLDSGGSIDGYIASVEALFDRAGPDTRIIAGHGPLATKADVKRKVEMLREARARIMALKRDGKNLEEVLAIDPLAEFHEDWAWFFITAERMTEVLYRGTEG